MEAPPVHHRDAYLLKRVSYQFQGERRTRCFRVLDGELSPVECPPAPEPPPGIGDAVAAATSAAGIKPCGACKRRQAALNRLTPGWMRRVLGGLFR
jgi:hypothetical protein